MNPIRRWLLGMLGYRPPLECYEGHTLAYKQLIQSKYAGIAKDVLFQCGDDIDRLDLAYTVLQLRDEELKRR